MDQKRLMDKDVHFQLDPFHKYQEITKKIKSKKQYSHIEYTKNPFNSYLRNGKLTGDSFVIIERDLYNEEEITYQYLKVEIAQL